ncbi:TPA: hypothetical protein JTP24_005337 [Escherichia coli]|nr:hypothetical protein [Escherichia coli]
MKTMKLNIDLGKYVITGTKHDLILSERGIIKEGENAGKETLSRIGYYSKFEHLVKELCNREILLSQAQTLQDIQQHIETLGVSLSTDAFLAEVKTEARKEGAYFVANRMLAAWEAGFIDDTAKNAADIARMILTSTEFMANAPEGDFDRSFSDGVLEDIAEQLRKGVIQ